MKVETVHDGIRYTLSNDGLETNDRVYPIASGRCIDKDGWILHGFDFSILSDGPHTIIELEYSNYKPEQVRTNYGYGPIEKYYKIIKMEEKVEERPESRFKTYKWVEVTMKLLALILILSLTSCNVWKKALYGKDPCDKSKPRQMERGHCKTEYRLGW
jgi:hypothetical protein